MIIHFYYSCFFFFFFSSRRRHTRFDCDWSSDVCSSDLLAPRMERTSAWAEPGHFRMDAKCLGITRTLFDEAGGALHRKSNSGCEEGNASVWGYGNEFSPESQPASPERRQLGRSALACSRTKWALRYPASA